MDNISNGRTEATAPVKKIRDHPACHSSRRVIKE